MYKNYLAILAFSMHAVVFAQPQLKVNTTFANVSPGINDGYVALQVTGGTPPYRYKWSDRNTPLDAHQASDLTEGTAYTVVVTDAAGHTVKKTVEVPAHSIPEHLNSLVKPLSAAIYKVLFFDPFTASGLYDPVVYKDKKAVQVPGWPLSKARSVTLKEWAVADGQRVKKGQLIALLSLDGKREVAVHARAAGHITQLFKPGESIYDSRAATHNPNARAGKLGFIRYDKPIPFLYPNGDKRERHIPFIVVWLILGALFFTLKMRFINFRGFRHAIRLARGEYDEPDAPGKVTHFQALTTALSGTVGLGNIAGVASAISLGGAGATFWMILAGLLGMSSKFVECSLGVKYRFISRDGRIFGGPMNYLKEGLAKRKLKGLGKVLAALFSILMIGASFASGNMYQANQAFAQLQQQFNFLHGYSFWFGILLAILVGAVILGGIKSIARVTEKVVPFMAGLYLLAALAVVFINIQNIGHAFQAILDGAFSPDAIRGGIIGVMIVGFQRAAFSNEAGIGSAAIAHSTVKTNHPVSEGFVACLGPFVDTVVICTLTALVIIFTNHDQVHGLAGVELTSEAFGTVLSWFPWILALAVFLFAFSTIISYSYYGMRAWNHLFGKSKQMEYLYKFIFCIFIVVGASVSLGSVLDLADMMILSMAFPNIFGLYILSGEVRKDLKAYLAKLKNHQPVQKPKT